MGRKIPGAKHHGVKDPIKQQEQRMKLLKQKINAPPSNPDDQPIPKSLTRLFEFKEKYEQRSKTKKPKKKFTEQMHEESQRHENPVSSLKRLPGESGRSFNMRINSAMHSINRSDAHLQQMKRSLDPDSCLPEEDDAKEDRLNFIERKKLKRKEKADKKKDANSEPTTKLSRMQRWSLKKKEKKAKHAEDADESKYEPKYEQIKFGEVVHGPPSLHIKPKKAKSIDGAPRPGQRDLLLSKLLNKSTDDSAPREQKKTTLDKKAKRKSLPVGVRMRLEQSQKDAIAAYRAMKAKAGKNK